MKAARGGRGVGLSTSALLIMSADLVEDRKVYLCTPFAAAAGVFSGFGKSLERMLNLSGLPERQRGAVQWGNIAPLQIRAGAE